MKNMYQSAAATKVSEGVGTSTISPERESRIIGGYGDYSDSALRGTIEDLEKLEKKIDQIGLNTGLARLFYGFTDAFGITSADSRLLGVIKGLQYKAGDLTNQIKAHADNLEEVTKSVREMTSLKSDAKSIMHKYMTMEQRLGDESTRLKEEQGRLKEELQKLAPNDPKYYVIQETIDGYASERDMMEDDALTIRNKMDGAGKAVVAFDMKLKYIDNERQVLRNTLNLLQQCKNKLDLKICEVEIYIKNKGYSVAGTFKKVKAAEEEYERTNQVLGTTFGDIDKTLARIGGEIDIQPFDSRNIEARTRELKKAQEKRDSDMIRQALEIERKDMAA